MNISTDSRKGLYFWVIIFSLMSLSGCALNWESAIRDAHENNPTPSSKQLLARAHHLYKQAGDPESLAASIAAYQSVLSHNPGDYEALVQLSNQYILLGTAYSKTRKEKSEIFQKAMRHAELAMYTNDRFKAQVRGGNKLWEAAEMLGPRETEAMFFWVTALQYEFKEGMYLVGKIRNVDWMRYGLVFLDRIVEVNPDFGGGAVEFAKGICYYVLPAFKGGSKKTGEAYMHEAVAKGKQRLLPRWGRGKYFYQITGNDEKSREDLAWVAAQNLEAVEDPYPWRIYFQQDAKALLK